MLPFYHPTSLLVVDDDQNFLNSLEFYFGDEFHCNLYKYPEKALLHVLEQEKKRQAAHLFFSDPDPNGRSINDDENRVILWQSAKILDLLKNSQRFRQNSVGIIDYDMPGMNGLELCRHLQDIPMRKILLTGKTGMDTALKLFNEGIIDCFLMKQQKDLSETLHKEILKLQKKYFKILSDLTNPAKCLNDMNFLEDLDFNAMFNTLIQNLHIEEFYLNGHPPSILLVQQNGNVIILVISSDSLMEKHINTARFHRAPEQLITMLEHRKILGYFPSSNGYYLPDFEKCWTEYVWPLQIISGNNKTWYYSLIEDNDLSRRICDNLISYNDFQEELDNDK